MRNLGFAPESFDLAVCTFGIFFVEDMEKQLAHIAAMVKPGETAVLADIQGAGIIHRMWLSGTIPRNEEQRRLVRLQMFWDDAKKPAVDCPIGDFFGVGLGLAVPFESALFQNPEGRSFNFTIPMPYRKGARLQIVNEARSYALVWYDLNYTEVKRHAADVMYFHAAWRRESKTEAGRDFEIMPIVVGKGRYLGANIGVIGGHPEYRGTWFGEGEVKGYLEGDTDLPTLVGTGTEDYIGTGWGQGVYRGRYFGSLVSDNENDLYAFYRYHLDDPVYFHKDCRVRRAIFDKYRVEYLPWHDDILLLDVDDPHDYQRLKELE